MYLQTPCGIFHFICWQLPRKERRKGNAVSTFRRCPVGISTATPIILGLLVIFLSSSRKISGLHLEEVKAASFYILNISLLKYTLPSYAIYSEILKRVVKTLSPELNPICYLLALLAHHFLHVSRIRVKSLTLRLLMSYKQSVSKTALQL
jgi:hypothetical protein